ncbi:DUF1934 domain-containing protein [Parablautia sp. Marseille-Q6255]|uniref:DUF1934 domain-containing protein n=1 Tax=Parablautia sp. Marseille-Q6255 TaxID=3039593 RepID=UPI0024BC429F|nr:DUF1934 domain-containing protein [Parablautia sp. Marseille-Q6255]
MIKEDILVSVKGLHTLDKDGEQEEIEVISPGKYYFKDGKHYIFYEEQPQDGTQRIRNRISLKDGFLEVQKNGAMSTKMVFERDKKSESWYNTPFGNLLAGVTVTDMQVKEQEQELDICVEYDLEVNYQRIADCRIEIKVMEKDSGLFHLR